MKKIIRKVHLNDLGIILGTRCNLKCGHCLGGNPKEQMTIQEKYIDDLIPNLTGIDELSFFGYELTLYISEAKMVFDKLLKAGIKINRFAVFTNAAKYSPALVEFVKYYKNYVTYPDKVMLHLSEDKFHYNNGFTVEKWHENVQKYIKELDLNNYTIQRFDNSVSYCEAATLTIRGRAKELNYEQLEGITKIDIPIPNQTNQYVSFRKKCEGSQNTCNNGECICNCIVSSIVLTPNGYVFKHDGMAFSAIDTGDYVQALGHISNMSLYDMVQVTNQKFDESKDSTIYVLFRDESSITWCTQKLLYDYLQNVKKILKIVNDGEYMKYLELRATIENEMNILTEKINASNDNSEKEYANHLFGIIKLDFETVCGFADYCFIPLMKILFIGQIEPYERNTPFKPDTFRNVVGIDYQLFMKRWEYYYNCDYDNYTNVIMKIMLDR